MKKLINKITNLGYTEVTYENAGGGHVFKGKLEDVIYKFAVRVLIKFITADFLSRNMYLYGNHRNHDGRPSHLPSSVKVIKS